MKKLSLILIVALVLSLLAGCAGTPVIYYTNCTCPVGSHNETAEPTLPPVVGEGAVKTGLYIGTDLSGSANAGEEAGKADFSVTVVAVNVDDAGVITACVIDSPGTSVSFDGTGAITSDPSAQILTKNELGADYGMVAWGGAIAEWDAQAAALANYAVGKTVEQLRSGAVNEAGYAADADLATQATIHLGGYVDCIEQAVANAQHLGAQAGDELRLAVMPSLGKSQSAGAENAGLAQLDMDAVALTLRDGVITSCYLDSLQAKVNFDATGAITTDLTVPVLTKNALGESYGMVAWGGAIAEWNVQAASLAAYVTGKTPAEVEGIAISEGYAAEADLATSVTIAISGYQALILKAAK